MSKWHKVTVNDETFSASRGDVLLDAALMAGIDIPHDCRAGLCGSCAVQLVEGQVYCANRNLSGHVLACQSRIVDDATFVVPDMPPIGSVDGHVSGVAELTGDVVELRIDTIEPRPYLPGQYFRLQFKGYPERRFSPTMPMDRASNGWHAFHFHIQRLYEGRVSSALGQEIRKAHPVTVTGPYGSAYLRPGLRNRLILVATGTGFAPIWSIATAALAENPNRPMVVIVGGRTVESLYMARALQRLAQYPNVEVIPTVSTPQTLTKSVRQGRPTEHMQGLNENDIVYVCGAPPMVEAARAIAAAAGATCYGGPFASLSEGDGEDSLLSWALNWIAGEGEDSLLSRAQNWIAGAGQDSLLSRVRGWINGLSTPSVPPMPMTGDEAPFNGFREPMPRSRRPQMPEQEASLRNARERQPAPPPRAAARPEREPPFQGFREQQPAPRPRSAPMPQNEALFDSFRELEPEQRPRPVPKPGQEAPFQGFREQQPAFAPHSPPRPERGQPREPGQRSRPAPTPENDALLESFRELEAMSQPEPAPFPEGDAPIVGPRQQAPAPRPRPAPEEGPHIRASREQTPVPRSRPAPRQEQEPPFQGFREQQSMPRPASRSEQEVPFESFGEEEPMPRPRPAPRPEHETPFRGFREQEPMPRPRQTPRPEQEASFQNFREREPMPPQRPAPRPEQEEPFQDFFEREPAPWPRPTPGSEGEVPFQGFREQVPIPDPWPTARPEQELPFEDFVGQEPQPLPAPPPQAEPRLAPQPVAEQWADTPPAPAPVEPQTVEVQPQPPVLSPPQAGTPSQTEAQPQPSAIQPMVRRIRPVLVVVPNDPQPTGPKVAAIPVRQVEPEVIEKGSTPAAPPSASPEAEPPVIDRVEAPLSSKDSEAKGSEVDGATSLPVAATEMVSAENASSEIMAPEAKSESSTTDAGGEATAGSESTARPGARIVRYERYS